MQSLGQRSNCCRSRKCIGWHIPVFAIFAVFFTYFSYLSYLGHLSLLGLQTKTKRQRNSSTFCSFKSHNPETFMSSAATAFVHATLKRSQKVPRAKSGTFWFPRTHNSASVDLDRARGILMNIKVMPFLATSMEVAFVIIMMTEICKQCMQLPMHTRLLNKVTCCDMVITIITIILLSTVQSISYYNT